MRSALLCVLVLCVAAVVADDLVRCFKPTTQDQTAFITQTAMDLNLDIWGVRSSDGCVLVRMPIHGTESDKLLELANQHHVASNIEVPSVAEALLADEIRNKHASMRASGFFDEYQSAEAINAFLVNLEKQYPLMAETFTAGHTFEGRPIRGIKINGKESVLNGTSGSDKPAIFYQGGQHAREWIAPAIVTYLAEHLLRAYEDDAVVRTLTNHFEYILVPVVNVDGYNHSRSGGLARMWRKNRRVNEGSSCIGVDTNRNWGYEWNTGGSSGLACVDTYRGTAPFSEFETSSIRDFIYARGNVVAFVDHHSFGQWFFTPYGYTKSSLPPDYDAQFKVGQVFAEAVYARHQHNFTVGSSAVLLYVASGGADDWAYGDAKVKATFSYTFEGRDTGKYGFLLPADQIVPSGEETFAGVKATGLAILEYFKNNSTTTVHK